MISKETKNPFLQNTLLYQSPQNKNLKRYDMVQYSKWRIYLFQQLQRFATKEREKLFKDAPSILFQKLFKQENASFYQFLFSPNLLYDGQLYRQDNISHFLCRLLYCKTQKNRDDFINYEKIILNMRLNSEKQSKGKFNKLSKQLLAKILDTDSSFNIPEQQWNDQKIRQKIIQGCPFPINVQEHSTFSIQDFAKIPFYLADSAIKKRRSFSRHGYTYVHNEIIIDIILWHYGDYMRKKLTKAEENYTLLRQLDTQNQLTTFLVKTIDIMNQSSIQQINIGNQQKLTLNNIQALWKNFFPPCMKNLTQVIKEKGHLKHDGRRQLWLFFKGCGMSSIDNQQFFRRHMGTHVSQSDMKSHIYNIQHAYGQVGKKSQQHSKNCRNIINGNPAKTGEYHGCPFKHWQSGYLRQYLKRNYRVSEDNLNKIIQEKQQNHYLFACGKLFETEQINQKPGKIPQQIFKQLGRSPYEYFQAGMEMSKNFQKKNNMELQF